MSLISGPGPATIDSIIARLSDKRKDEEPGQGEKSWIAELVQTDSHSSVTEGRLRTIGAHEPVPPGHVKAEVAVGLCWEHRVMDPVHVRRHHKQSQNPIQ